MKRVLLAGAAGLFSIAALGCSQAEDRSGDLESYDVQEEAATTDLPRALPASFRPLLRASRSTIATASGCRI